MVQMRFSFLPFSRCSSSWTVPSAWWQLSRRLVDQRLSNLNGHGILGQSTVLSVKLPLQREKRATKLEKWTTGPL
jgi:hypothetical protein